MNHVNHEAHPLPGPMPYVFRPDHDLDTTSNEYEARHDALTGLLNARGYKEATEYLSKNIPGQFSVVEVDLDKLKPVNDALGHAVGDMLLQRTSEALSNTVRGIPEDSRDIEKRKEVYPLPDIVCARVGGDEFVAILIGADDEESAMRGQQRLAASLEANGIDASLGCAVHKPGKTSKDTLIEADHKMLEQKAQAKEHARKINVEKQLSELSASRRIAYSIGSRLMKMSGFQEPSDR